MHSTGSKADRPELYQACTSAALELGVSSPASNQISSCNTCV
jgi:hypothetical protein